MSAGLPPVPAFDLGRAARRIEEQVEARWRSLRRDTAFVGGPAVDEFEAAFARYLGAAGCVGVANGTDALELAVRALGVRPGDEVVVPAFTFVATASAVLLAGARPVLADVESETLNLDLASAAQAAGPKAVGLIGVHLYGRPFDVDRARRLCEERGLWLLEDAAQAHGAKVGSRRAGVFGDLATWSFYPSKNLGCFGDGGALSGPDLGLLERARRISNHGRRAQYEHVVLGRNSRLDALQAAVLACRLELLDADNERRRQIARRYRAGLEGVGDLELLRDAEGAESVYHQFTVRTGRREALRGHLAERGIGSGVYYPLPLHRQPALADVAAPVPLPVSEAAAEDVVSLPMFPELTDAEADRVIEAVREHFGA